ncbi:MAG TPA: hypothetical protein VF297_05375 [Pyrinomonadaceae bacterium]
MHIESLSNGMGGQSMYLLWLAGQRRIPATYSITADTGSELDCLWSTGERTTAAEFFARVVKPLADEWGIDARFVRAVDKNENPLPPLHEYARQFIHLGDGKKQMMPLYGIRGKNGRSQLRQTCTERWKVAAINQEARRLGAKTLRTAQGIHIGEYDRRCKGIYLRDEEFNGQVFSVYQTTRTVKGETIVIKWLSHYYPLVDLKMNREAVAEEMRRLNIPYLVTSECDMCPHKDWPRWQRTSPETVDRIAEHEAEYQGQFFFTDRRVPLKEALTLMAEAAARGDAGRTLPLFDGADFGCRNDVCGV